MLGLVGITPVAAAAPESPTIGTATVTGQTTATVGFTASPTGDAATSFSVTSTPAGGTGSGATSPISVTGLAPGTAYTFQVIATNGDGSSAPSTASNEITTDPATVPGAPVIGSAAATGATTATVTFTAPGNNGGSPITSYTVTSAPGGVTATGASSPITVTGLSGGTSYTFTVVATNGVGSGAASAASNQITTSNVPGAPSIDSVTLTGNTTATIGFSAPGNNGGSTITSYSLEVSPDTASLNVPTLGGAATSVSVSGLDPCTTYTFRLRAANAIGSGPLSAASSSVTARGISEAPTAVTAATVTPFEPSSTVTWTAPSGPCANSTPITGYRVSYGGKTATVNGGETSASFTGIAAGSWAASVVAINLVGDSLPASSSPVEVRGFAPFASETAFIGQQYRDFLDRSPDTAGLNYWRGQTNDGRGNVANIIEAFMRSPEFAPRRSISRLYLAFFDRAPDQSGFDFWAVRIRTGRANLDTVSEQFVRSPEFVSTYGQLNDAEFVFLVYNNVLVRRPDQSGFQYWVGRLGAGMTRGEMMTQFSESPEFIAASRPAVDVIVTYRGMLNREPDGPGFAFWIGRIAGNPNSLRELILQFYNTAEYAGRITP